MKFLIPFLFCLTAYASEAPYSGQQMRSIKSLSDDQIQKYLDGAGMGLAKAAELNSYPGPKHVLELREQLELTQEQEKKTREIYEIMHKRAVELGNRVIELESKLDNDFSNKTISSAILQQQLLEIGKVQAELRFVHLRAHLDQKLLLTPHQIALYNHLRGYSSNSNHHLH